MENEKVENYNIYIYYKWCNMMSLLTFVEFWNVQK